jgi:NAD(P)-dependent dehydrogenase (short-subunit alcohol dehydrogenase family)
VEHAYGSSQEAAMMSAESRVVMISGANRGIGAAIARRLAAAGSMLSLGVRNTELVEVGDPARSLIAHYDARERDAAKSWVAATVARYGRIDALINNAGISRMAPVEDENEEALDDLWLVNVKAPLRLIRAALPYLKQSGAGRVINVASLSGKRVRNANTGYAMSKFALVALTHSVRRLGWEHGIRATALCPGFVATDMSADVKGINRAEMIQPEDLAELVACLLALPNNATVAELLVNMRHEDTL